MEEKKTFWEKLKSGSIPVDLNTNVGLDRNSLVNLAAVVFIAGFLIVLTWYVFKKRL